MSASFFLASCMVDNNDSTFTCGDKISDRDGYTYNTVRIGDYCILASNLNTVTFPNGSIIPQVSDAAAWIASDTPSWSYQLNSPNYSTDFGKLYNWSAVGASQNLCPENWKVPSQQDWFSILDVMGGLEVAGGPLKSPGTALWQSPNTGATNSSGFTGNPGGRRTGLSGEFQDVYKAGFWWSTTEDERVNGAVGIVLKNDHHSAEIWLTEKQTGMSVRCIYDNR